MYQVAQQRRQTPDLGDWDPDKRGKSAPVKAKVKEHSLCYVKIKTKEFGLPVARTYIFDRHGWVDEKGNQVNDTELSGRLSHLRNLFKDHHPNG